MSFLSLRRRATIRIVLSALVVLGLVYLYFRIYGTGKEHLTRAPSVAETGYLPESKVVVELFFASGSEGTLVGEEREIYREPTMLAMAEAVLKELLKGPQGDAVSPFPQGTELIGFFLSDDGTAYVNFSRELMKNHVGGTLAESLTVASVVETLISNFDKIERVRILVDGSEVDTLAGHVNLMSPLKGEHAYSDTKRGLEGSRF